MATRVPLRIRSALCAGLRVGAALACLALPSVLAQGRVALDWSRTLTAYGGQLYGAMVGVAADDAIYVTGYYPNYRIITAKFTPNGTPLWQVDFSNPGTREHASPISNP